MTDIVIRHQTPSSELQVPAASHRAPNTDKSSPTSWRHHRRPAPMTSVQVWRCRVPAGERRDQLLRALLTGIAEDDSQSWSPVTVDYTSASLCDSRKWQLFLVWRSTLRPQFTTWRRFMLPALIDITWLLHYVWSQEVVKGWKSILWTITSLPHNKLRRYIAVPDKYITLFVCLFVFLLFVFVFVRCKRYYRHNTNSRTILITGYITAFGAMLHCDINIT